MRAETSEFLYHTTLTIIEYNLDASGSIQTVDVLGTHTDLAAAKSFARSALLTQLHYEQDDFAVYEVRESGAAWAHGDGVLAYAKAPAGQVLLVGLDTKPNDEELPGTVEGTVVLPEGVTHLHYVLQTCVDYNEDRSGGCHTTEIEGCYAHRADAIAAAKKCLVEEESGFAEYDEKADLNPQDEWPFGDDVLVHAVSQSGQILTVAVCTVPEVQQKHSKKRNQNNADN